MLPTMVELLGHPLEGTRCKTAS